MALGVPLEVIPEQRARTKVRAITAVAEKSKKRVKERRKRAFVYKVTRNVSIVLKVLPKM